MFTNDQISIHKSQHVSHQILFFLKNNLIMALNQQVNQAYQGKNERDQGK
jgi:hypothetical protein